MDKTSLKRITYPEEECDKDLRSQNVPDLAPHWSSFTLLVFLIRQSLLETFKWLCATCLDSVKRMHNVGLHVRVLRGSDSVIQ
jgi:hypothetical protein